MDHLDYCEQQTNLFCDRLLHSCWQNLDGRIYELAQPISDPKQRRQIFLAMQDAQKQSDQIAARLAAQNQHNFIRFRDKLPLRHRSPGATTPASDLEDSLATSRIITDVLGAQQHPLWQINKRMALLRGGLQGEERDNPLCPAAICLGFQIAVRSIPLDSGIRLTLLDVFGKLFRIQTAQFYQTVNQYMAGAGILPNLLQSVPSRPGNASDHSDDGHRRLLIEGELRLDRILSRLDRQTTWPEPIQQAFATPRILRTDHYLQCSTRLQQASAKPGQATENTPPRPGDSLVRYYQMLSREATAQGAGLNRGLLLMTELVTLLFEQMIEHPLIPAPVRHLIRILHAPYLGLAITDRSFFLQAEHPARRILDTLCYQGTLRCASHIDDDPVLPRLQQTINRLACAPSGNKNRFEDSWASLQPFLDQIARQGEIRERRCVSAQQGLHALESARLAAAEQVRRSLCTHRVKVQEFDILQAPCTDFLTFTLLQQGQNNHWDRAVRLMDGIAMSVRGQLPSSQLMQFQRGQQRLCRALRKGLSTAGYRGMLAQDLIGALRQAQALALQSLACSDETSQNPEPEIAPLPHPAMQHLTTDHWYMWQQTETQPARALKLAWHCAKARYFLFVDTLGRDVLTADAPTLQEAWQQGRLKDATLPPLRLSEALLSDMLTQSEQLNDSATRSR